MAAAAAACGGARRGGACVRRARAARCGARGRGAGARRGEGPRDGAVPGRTRCEWACRNRKWARRAGARSHGGFPDFPRPRSGWARAHGAAGANVASLPRAGAPAGRAAGAAHRRRAAPAAWGGRAALPPRPPAAAPNPLPLHPLCEWGYAPPGTSCLHAAAPAWRCVSRGWARQEGGGGGRGSLRGPGRRRPPRDVWQGAEGRENSGPPRRAPHMGRLRAARGRGPRQGGRESAGGGARAPMGRAGVRWAPARRCWECARCRGRARCAAPRVRLIRRQRRGARRRGVRCGGDGGRERERARAAWAPQSFEAARGGAAARRSAFAPGGRARGAGLVRPRGARGVQMGALGGRGAAPHYRSVWPVPAAGRAP
jgi:hypothetical protein